MGGACLHLPRVRVRRQQWQFMAGALKALAAEEGLREPSFEDLLWAHGVFWSRGQSLPVPSAGAGGLLHAATCRPPSTLPASST